MGGELGESVNDLLIRNPTLVVGIGGAGSRISRQAAGNLECRNLLVSSDRKDLDDSERSILVESGGWINPSTFKLRSFVQGQKSEILAAIKGYSTIVLISNLAGRSGCAMAPDISSLAKEFGAT